MKYPSLSQKFIRKSWRKLYLLSRDLKNVQPQERYPETLEEALSLISRVKNCSASRKVSGNPGGSFLSYLETKNCSASRKLSGNPGGSSRSCLDKEHEAFQLSISLSGSPGKRFLSCLNTIFFHFKDFWKK